MPEELFASTLEFITHVHDAYTSLTCLAPASEELSLGGQLFYVGELDDSGRAFTVAANIAEAATLAVSAQTAALRQAQHEGVIDFLVNSLDEALRILKNEIRKREAVAVAISLPPEAVEVEMMNRGLLPNLLPPKRSAATLSAAVARFLSQGAQPIPPRDQDAQKLLIWPSPAEYAQNLAGFESILAEHLTPGDHLTRHWLRRSPRYLGPATRRLRSVACDGETAAALAKLLGPPLNT